VWDTILKTFHLIRDSIITNLKIEDPIGLNIK
jgi:hypothetical protein